MTSNESTSTDPRLIVWAWGALEADFQRYYRMDLNDEVFGKAMTARRLGILVRGLPADSAFAWWLKDTKNRDFATYDPSSLGSVLQEYAYDTLEDM